MPRSSQLKVTRLNSDYSFTCLKVDRVVSVSERARLQHYEPILIEKLEPGCVIPLVVVDHDFSDDTVFGLDARNPSIWRVD